MRIASRLRTYLALGPANLVRVAVYRIALRLRIHPVLRVRQEVPTGRFFDLPKSDATHLVPRETWRDQALYFGYHRFPIAGIPDWHANPFRPGARAEKHAHWSTIADFDPCVGDIKTVWEASRFDWLVAMAQRGALGDAAEFERLNAWLADWVENNPPYRGANWKCGQEASIRVMHLALAAVLMNQVDAPQTELLSLIRMHLARIAPTMSYAIGQQNNHGTSEAAALFIGGAWLAAHGDRQGSRWATTGRKWLENRARKLILADGTFSQYSAVYHRLMLDTYSFVETWRAILCVDRFSSGLYERLCAATWWLRQLTDLRTGDVPNLGANDGARILALTDADFRDFRPSLQWASSVFVGRRALGPGPWDRQLSWLNLSAPPEELDEPQSQSFDEGGLHVLRQARSCAYLRYPRFRFRPSQCDALHVDFWLDGSNVLRDGGTYSYNCDWGDLAYFSGVASHNTAQFDSREQMPRLGRFLFGDWLKATDVRLAESVRGAVRASAGYRDSLGARHLRSLELGQDYLICRDQLGGSARRAVIRWRLRPGDWRLVGNRLQGENCSLTVEGDSRGVELHLAEGSESRFYLHRNSLPVLEIRARVPSRIETHLTF